MVLRLPDSLAGVPGQQAGNSAMPGQVILRALCCNVHVDGLAQHASISPEMHAASGAVVQLPVNLVKEHKTA